MSHKPAVFTAEALLGILRALPRADEYVVGFSGGADSTALLHALDAIQGQLGAAISAVHVNHGIHPDADLWQRLCETFCSGRGIRLACLKICLDNHSGSGLEAAARQLRYAAISGLLGPATCLLTAHHADDQAETLLLNLMRGSGVDGLAAMPVSRPLGRGVLLRPLLEFQGSSLQDYLSEHRIGWAEDPSNQHLGHDRNFVRHEIVPLLERRWPGVSKRLLLTQKAMREARHLLETVADDYLGEHLAHPQVLHIEAAASRDEALLKLVTRRWLKRAGAPSMPAYRLESFVRQVCSARHGNRVTAAWEGWVLRLYRQKLWLQTDEPIPPCPALNWPAGCAEAALGSQLGLLALSGATPALPDGDFAIVGRKAAHEMPIRHLGHHKTLKKIFQVLEIPPWLRDSIPLCKLDGELAAVGPWFLSDRFARWLSDGRLELSWQPDHPLLQFILAQRTAKTA